MTLTKMCSVSGCSGKHKGKGLCAKHLRRFNKHGDPSVGERIATAGECVVLKCLEPQECKGFCGAHYRRFLKYGDAEFRERDYLPDKCTILDCSSPPHSKGMCNRHYRRTLRLGSHELPKQVLVGTKKCAIFDCLNFRKNREWCEKHYEKWRHYGDPTYVWQTTDSKCGIVECSEPRYSQRFCQPHHYRWVRYGNPTATPLGPPRKTNFKSKLCVSCEKTYVPKGPSSKYCGSSKCYPPKAKRGYLKSRSWVAKLGLQSGWVCSLCDRTVDPSLRWPHPESGSVDHIIAVSSGGGSHPDNLALAHLGCNCARNSSTIEDYQGKIKRLEEAHAH